LKPVVSRGFLFPGNFRYMSRYFDAPQYSILIDIHPASGVSGGNPAAHSYIQVSAEIASRILIQTIVATKF
jgi:hypothetical protein